MREALLQSQYHGAKGEFSIAVICAGVLTVTNLMAVLLENMKANADESFSEWYASTTRLFWGYNIFVALAYFTYGIQNFVFLQGVMLDFQRRNYISNLLTSMLEVDINRKSPVSVRMLSINFMHPPSLLTWLELVRMVPDLGKRFFLRV